MLSIAVFSFVIPAVVLAIDVCQQSRTRRRMRGKLVGVDAEFESALKKIDEPVRKLLGEGKLRLIKCDWLLDRENDARLPRVTLVKCAFKMRGVDKRHFSSHVQT